tara:strand:- start:6591 stop:7685 length:1095 start_codon:yes stop_codon:yes gene_type:complete
MKKNPYSVLKILHHHDKIEEIRKNTSSSLVSVRMVLADLCNQNCHFCTFRMENSITNKLFRGLDKGGNVTYNPSRFLAKDKCLEILDDASDMGVKSIEFTGGGEPTVHPEHVEVFEYTIKKGMELGLITNGVVSRPGFEDVMMRSSWIRFSLDAGKSKSYAAVREVPEKTFKKVLQNIESLTKKKNVEKSNLTVGISFIVTDQNFLEVYESAKIASDLGVDYFRVGYYRTDDGFVAGDFAKTQELIEKSTADFSREDFSVLNRYNDASKNIDERPDYEFCAYQHINTWIAADYNVYRCCVTSYDDHGLIGSLRNQTFKELWASEEKKKKFDEFDARTCTQCIYNEKNKILNYLLFEKPDHKNFI